MTRTLVVFILFSIALFAQQVRVDHASVELISEVSSIVPGQSFWAALKIDHDEHWHTYWRNAGDAGIPTKMEWDLPEGFKADEIQWPFPKRIMVADVANFGFEHELILPVKIQTPKNISYDESVKISIRASWLICKEECLPGEAELSLTLPVSRDVKFNDLWVQTFNETREKLPLTNHEWEASLLELSDSLITFSLHSFNYSDYALGEIFFYPYQAGFIKNSSSQIIDETENGFTITIGLEDFIVGKPDSLRGILVSEYGWRGKNTERAIEIDIPINNTELVINNEQDSESSVFMAIIFAFIGGIILNLMPCVLPVLSIKILGFVQQAGEDKSKIISHGLFFTLGVVASFLLLAIILLLLRAGGEQLGWGFQLQSPLFLIILSVFLLLFSLSLFGVFEIGFGAGKVGGRIENKNGSIGAVLSGVAATLLATPCTAPFMGSALGYAITQPTYITLSVFTALGFGMAFPYLLLSIFPQWLKFIPKPGNWMNTLKQFMGFLLLATILWLTWVLGIQAGSSAIIGLLGGLLITGLAGWIFGNWGSVLNKKRTRLTATVISVLLVSSAVYTANTFVNEQPLNRTTNEQSNSSINWQKFSQTEVDELISISEYVFIDFTAAWCLSCQVNEKVALNTKEVVNKFAELDVKAFKADWTSRDPEITEALSKFGRNSVPLYVLYNKKGGPIILPEILTPGIVLNALEKLQIEKTL